MVKSKSKTIFRCQSCGFASPKWLGKCPECEKWNTFIEEQLLQGSQFTDRRLTKFSSSVVKLDEISTEKIKRINTGINEFDRILGGGIMPASIVLLGGPPGIGKSTLMLQVAYKIVKNSTRKNVLYVTGEESLEQVKNRADRLKISDGFYIVSETNLENILEIVKKVSPEILIIDSIQTIYRSDLSGAPGSVGQVRECTAELLHLAKGKNITIFLLGHVTKEGDIAGPRVLEHIVDTVLYFEAEKHHTYRILRSYKNRFGPTSEIGVFEMLSDGLREVSNPSLVFLSERLKDVSGSVVTVNIEGTRPIMLEVQALVTKSDFGVPRRMSSGIDYNRSVLLISILENRIGLGLTSFDIYVNVAGGVKIKDPSSDLAVCCAIYSAFSNKPISQEFVFIGEVGLAGEIRGVNFIEERINESEKMGFKKIFIPKANYRNLIKKREIEIIPVDKLSFVIDFLK